MTFWLVAAAIPLLTALVLFRPLLRKGAGNPGLALALVALLPITTLLLYQGVGRPDAVNLPQAAVPDGEDMESLLAQLQARMDAQPDDLEGWMLLGRSYRSIQRYGEALNAFIRARELAPDNPVVAVELAEALLFNAPPDAPDPQVQTLLEEALAVAPDLQKGLWLAGMVAAQAGDDARAVAWWERLVAQLEPGSDVAASVQTQLDAARARLGTAAAGPATQSGAPDIPAGRTSGEAEPASAIGDTSPGAWAGIDVVVEAPEALPKLGPEAALFIIARDPDAPNPPLGAVRLTPAFPARARLSDANAMLPQRPISGVADIQLQARLSPDGNPMGGENSLESSAVTVARDTGEPVTLTLDPAGQ